MIDGENFNSEYNVKQQKLIRRFTNKSHLISYEDKNEFKALKVFD